MIETNTDSGEFSLAKGREFLQRGDVSGAVEYYEHAYDPDALDEAEARNMLIEARSHLSKKFLLEALECFEEALVMGTEVQRRQALDGIAVIGETRSRLGPLTAKLKRGLKSILGKKTPVSKGLALVSDDENLVLVSDEVLNSLPVRLAAGKRVSKLPQRFADYPVVLQTNKCIPYTDEEDVDYILEVAEALAEISS
jgi:tetratricopeptide (TPR) repeat protein